MGHPSNFPSMPYLYMLLNLFSNKDKRKLSLNNLISDVIIMA